MAQHPRRRSPAPTPSQSTTAKPPPVPRGLEREERIKRGRIAYDGEGRPDPEEPRFYVATSAGLRQLVDPENGRDVFVDVLQARRALLELLDHAHGLRAHDVDERLARWQLIRAARRMVRTGRAAQRLPQSIADVAEQMACDRVEWERLQKAGATAADDLTRRKIRARMAELGRYPWFDEQQMDHAVEWPPDSWEPIWDALELVPGLGRLGLAERSLARGGGAEGARNRRRGLSTGKQRHRRRPR